jgi:hypothetical protein
VSLPINNAPTSVDVDRSVVAGVLEAVGNLESPRPDLVAIAIALAALMDNPKATSSKPPAAGRLMQVMEMLRKSSEGARRGRLASVRALSSKKET